MNDSQKRYTVMEIQKYKRDVELLEKKATINRWFILGCLTLMFAASEIRDLDNVYNKVDVIADIVRFVSLSNAIGRFKAMIEIISQKTGLKNMAIDLLYQLNNDDLSDKKRK